MGSYARSNTLLRQGNSNSSPTPPKIEGHRSKSVSGDLLLEHGQAALAIETMLMWPLLELFAVTLSPRKAFGNLCEPIPTESKDKTLLFFVPPHPCHIGGIWAFQRNGSASLSSLPSTRLPGSKVFTDALDNTKVDSLMTYN